MLRLHKILSPITALLTAVLMLSGAAAAQAAATLTHLKHSFQLNQSPAALAVKDVSPGASKVTLYDLAKGGPAIKLGETTVIDALGTATIALETPLSEGPQSLELTETIDDVEVGTSSFPLMGTLTRTAPSVVGALEYTQNRRPSFFATGLLSNQTEPKAAGVLLYVDDVKVGSVIGHDGSWADIAPDHDLSEGLHQAYVVTVDDLGQESTVRSNAFSFRVDLTAPPVVALAPVNGSTVSGPLTQVTVQSEPGAFVWVELADDEDYRFADENGVATLTLTKPLTAGAHTVTIGARDEAMNVTRDELTFTVVSPDPTPEPTPDPTPDPVADPTPTPDPAATPAPVATPTPTSEPATPAQPKQVTLSAKTLTAAKPVKVAFTLARPGTVKLTLTRVVRGRTKTVASVSAKIKKPGRSSITLRNKVGTRRLPRGTYKLTLQVVDGKQRSRPVTQRLTVK